MKRDTILTTLTTTAVLALAAQPALAQLQLPRVSPAASVTQTIATTEMTVSYSRPGVKDRVIWGELVPHDKVWRTGANEATTFKTSGDVMIGGEKLAAGTYALFTVPGEDSWQVVFNTQAEQWGSGDHDESKDVLKLTVKPEAAPHREWMQFTFENLGNKSGDLVLSWEKKAVRIPIEVDIDPILESVKTAMTEAKEDDWRMPYRAASFCLDYGVATDEGMKWAESSTKIEQNYYNMSLLARYQAESGNKKDAIQTAETAVALGQKAERPVETTATERLIAQWKGN